MCRSFIIGTPSASQKRAHARVLEVIAHVERKIRPGVRCRDVYEAARGMLEGYEGWAFPHHLGHGIGMNQHEAPRLNPHWDDEFESGDVLTLEPGLYAPELRAGVRVEQVYSLAESGLTVLTSFPTSLDGRTVKV
jgi:Xaa-Pro aminopeptidase